MMLIFCIFSFFYLYRVWVKCYLFVRTGQPVGLTYNINHEKVRIGSPPDGQHDCWFYVL